MFPRRVDGERYVGRVVELLDEQSYRRLDCEDRCGVVEKGGTEVYWNTVLWREDGGFEFARDDTTTFGRIGRLTDRTPAAVEAEFERKHRYVKHMLAEGIDDFETIFSLLADLQTNEAATVERLSRQTESHDDEATAKTGDD